MPSFSNNSKVKLSTCDPRLQEILYEAIEIVDFTIMEGHRGEAAQNKAFAEKKSKLKWPNGNHNKRPSTAVDIAPWLPGWPNIDWDDLIAFGRLMGIVQAIAFRKGIKLRFGLDWDGDFRSVNRDATETFLDAPHVEVLD